MLAESEIINRIKGFASLGENWNSYGAKTIEWSTINRAIDFLSNIISEFPNASLPFVAPGPNGEIHFEWDIFPKTLVLSIPEDKNDAFEYVTSGKEGKMCGRSLNMEEMLNIVICWMR